MTRVPSAVMNRTFVMAKPDAVERGLIGEIVARLERKGLRLVAAEHRMVDENLAAAHYAEHQDKPFYGELISFITRAPVFAMVVEGPADNTFSLVRMLVGATKVAHVEDALAAEALALTDEELTRLEEPYVPHLVAGIDV